MPTTRRLPLLLSNGESKPTSCAEQRQYMRRNRSSFDGKLPETLWDKSPHIGGNACDMPAASCPTHIRLTCMVAAGRRYFCWRREGASAMVMHRPNHPCSCCSLRYFCTPPSSPSQELHRKELPSSGGRQTVVALKHLQPPRGDKKTTRVAYINAHRGVWSSKGRKSVTDVLIADCHPNLLASDWSVYHSPAVTSAQSAPAVPG